jgi:hypothetical protein
MPPSFVLIGPPAVSFFTNGSGVKPVLSVAEPKVGGRLIFCAGVGPAKKQRTAAINPAPNVARIGFEKHIMLKLLGKNTMPNDPSN